MFIKKNKKKDVNKSERSEFSNKLISENQKKDKIIKLQERKIKLLSKNLDAKKKPVSPRLFSQTISNLTIETLDEQWFTEMKTSLSGLTMHQDYFQTPFTIRAFRLKKGTGGGLFSLVR